MSAPDQLSATPKLAHWIESDTYDRHAFARVSADSPSLQALQESGNKLLPHFDDFLLDLFALLFKLNVIVHPEEAVVPSAVFYRFVIDELRATPALDRIRQETVLDETAAALATLLLGEAFLELLKSERVLTRGEMLDVWNIDQQVDDLAKRAAEAATAEHLRVHLTGQTAERQLIELQNRMQRDTALAQRRLAQHARQMSAAFAESEGRRQPRIVAQFDRVMQDLEVAAEETEQWSLQLGSAQRSSPGAQIELGHRLARNPKLKRMARLVGRMREQARALRQKLYERANTEMYSVGLGAELSHLLPSELLSLRHPLLRRDFARRLIDGELLVYALRTREDKGRGPMIVCLDGSSSMAGDKEIWSKAVTLTLLDIASRQRRRFRSICFSSAETPLQILDLNQRQRYAPNMREVFALAEYFPGGGTDFQAPLNAALECLRHATHKRGDIVFITDGECRVDTDWLSDFRREKEKLGFSLFSVLIDVGSSSLGALKEFSDQITSVAQLTSDASRDIFLEF